MHTVDVVKISGGSVYYKKCRYVGGLPTPEFQVGSLVFHDKTDAVALFRIWDAVRRCIVCNAVERGGCRWGMTRGVVQGDRLSVALCDLLLSDLHAARLTDRSGISSSESSFMLLTQEHTMYAMYSVHDIHIIWRVNDRGNVIHTYDG